MPSSWATARSSSVPSHRARVIATASARVARSLSRASTIRSPAPAPRSKSVRRSVPTRAATPHRRILTVRSSSRTRIITPAARSSTGVVLWFSKSVGPRPLPVARRLWARARSKSATGRRLISAAIKVRWSMPPRVLRPMPFASVIRARFCLMITITAPTPASSPGQGTRGAGLMRSASRWMAAPSATTGGTT